MRTLVLTAALLLAAFPLPAARAEGHLLEDARGDTVAFAGAQGAATPAAPFHDNPQSDSTDLLALDVAETDDALGFVLTVASLDGTFTGSVWSLLMTWNDRAYRAELVHFVTGPQTYDAAYLQVQDATKEWTRVADLAMKLDAGGKVSTSIPKAYLLDGQGRMPVKGDALKDVRVESDRTANFDIDPAALALSIADRMPDSGAGSAYALQKGDTASGALRLDATQRVRVSNGGATTFVYQAQLRNSGATEEDAQLSVSDLPQDWTAKVPATLHVPAGGNRTFTVLASIPFAHKHGGFDAFTITAKSGKDASSFATLRLGVLHTPIPQPAGHHSELYLHGTPINAAPLDAAFNYALMWMSTDAAHDADPPMIPPNACPQRGTHVWDIPLNPALAIGVDFDMERTGTLAGSLVPNTKGTGTLTAKLYLVSEGEGTFGDEGFTKVDHDKAILLADGAPVPVVAELNAPFAFNIKLTPKPQADYIPFEPHKNLLLELTFVNDQQDVACSGVQPIVPNLVSKDLKMTLPLNEYQDRLDGVAEAASVLEIKAEGPVEKRGRPGTTMTYSFTLSNAGLTGDSVQLEAAGNDAKLATLVPNGVVALAPHESKAVLVGVKIPADAQPGVAYEILLYAHSKADPSKTAVARTKTIVVTGADAHDDEAGVLQQAAAKQKKSPGVELAGALAVAALVAIAARRRR